MSTIILDHNTTYYPKLKIFTTTILNNKRVNRTQIYVAGFFCENFQIKETNKTKTTYSNNRKTLGMPTNGHAVYRIYKSYITVRLLPLASSRIHYVILFIRVSSVFG